MASVVFILGAGASKGAGAPLMKDFLATAENLYKTGKVEKYSADFKRVFEARGKLLRILSKSELDLNNIEVIFNTLEMAKIIGKFPDGDKKYIYKTIKSLRKLISVTLEKSIRWQNDRDFIMGLSPRETDPPTVYMEFAKLIKYLSEESSPKQDVAILTFNYDFALDFALHYSGIKANYFLDNTNKKGIPLLKLHGSVNWSKCPKCNKIIPIPFGEHLGRHGSTISFLDYFDKWQHCKNKDMSTEPFIIPPTWNKTDAHSKISNVWQQAAKELSEAEYIFISGYSMPESDMFFRLLYALGTEGPNLLKKISVFDIEPYPESKIEKRYNDILGPWAKKAFHYYTSSFEKMPDIVKNIIAEQNAHR